MHIVDSLERGGLERVVTDLAIAQKRQGQDVCVLSLLDTEGLKSELLAQGVEVVVAGKTRPFDLRVLRTIRRSAAERQVEVVHAHNFVPNYYAAVALCGMPRRPTLVGTCHDMGTRLSSRKLSLFYAWSLRRTAAVAMVGRQVHDRFVGGGIVPGAKATTVLNGIPVERFAPSAERRTRARAALGLAPDALVIGAVGRLVPLKNHRLLIEALPTLAALHPQLRLVLIGGGPLEQELRDEATRLGVAGRVVFAGLRPDVAELTPAFDVFAMPSLTEGLSIALLEACATGLAVVATRVGGNPEIVSHGHTGLLVPAADAGALQQALAELLGQPAQRERLGQAAAAWVRAHASIDTLCRAYDDFYARARGRPAPQVLAA
ncbi:glycosyltransferase [Aquabacterium sp. A7-Y]|uniref:glycosyltransferase n=1 Tax=Aquabacterium sp. A7-Y TaxID=1349605 RepID=UPI00223CEA64|nr:glycosyltransferase [Aquabacterium sp. A7-Y]MCW7537511.1 glycosyltransferase [Aquabacterium sp. A7-Y]